MASKEGGILFQDGDGRVVQRFNGAAIAPAAALAKLEGMNAPVWQDRFIDSKIDAT